MKLVTVNHYQSIWHFSRSWSQRSRSQTTGSENALCSRGIL